MLSLLYSLTGCADAGVDAKPAKKEIIVPQAEYTVEQPGEWRGIEDEHLPKISFQPNESEGNIVVHVDLKTRSPSHYLERIGIMTEDKKDLAGTAFNRNSTDYTVRMTIHANQASGKIKVYAKCNLHDLWTVSLISQPGDEKPGRSHP